MGACLISKSIELDSAAACPLIHNVPTWAVRHIARYAVYKTCQTLRNLLLSHLLLEVLSCCVLGGLYRLAVLAVLHYSSYKAAAASPLQECML